MIDYGLFHYAGPPRTGSTWFMRACALAGLGEGSKSHVHLPHQTTATNLRVITIRHPYDWLQSYYREIGGAFTGVPAVDKFRCLDFNNAFDSFIRSYLDTMPGAVSKMFEAYNADSCVKVEDMPWALQELLVNCGMKRIKCEPFLSLPPINQSSSYVSNPSTSLRECVLEAEQEFIEHYEY